LQSSVSASGTESPATPPAQHGSPARPRANPRTGVGYPSEEEQPTRAQRGWCVSPRLTGGKPNPGIPRRPDPYSPASRTPARWRTPTDTPATPPSRSLRELIRGRWGVKTNSGCSGEGRTWTPTLAGRPRPRPVVDGFPSLTTPQFHVLITLFSKFFASFDHSTCSLSVSCQYLAL